ncbi:ferredoxin [Lysobacteraceae bacterium NML91-0213]|nr:ferredoxin [Xanthomonadaceae bacterium NML91-0213]
MPHDHASTQPGQHDDCIEACTRCHAICLETIAHCLRQGGRHVEPAHMTLMMACADICRTSADTMLRGADVHVHTCAACAAICRACAESCAALADGDPAMQRCADACAECARHCEEMAA